MPFLMRIKSSEPKSMKSIRLQNQTITPESLDNTTASLWLDKFGNVLVVYNLLVCYVIETMHTLKVSYDQISRKNNTFIGEF